MLDFHLPSVYSFTFVGTLFIITFCCVTIEVSMTDPYQTLLETAADCRQNERYLHVDGCNWCTCVERGVVICTQKTCWDYPDQASEENSALRTELSKNSEAALRSQQHDDDIYNFARTCKNGESLSKPDDCSLCFCEAQGVIRCTKRCEKSPAHTVTNRLLKKDISDSEKRNYLDIQRKASQCQTTDEPIVEGCKKCVCVRTGVMSCRLIPDCKPFDYFPKWVTQGKQQCQDLIDGCKKCVCQPNGGMKCERIPGCSNLDRVTKPMPKYA